MVSKKELVEKRRKDEEEAAHVFEEFIETFQIPTNKSVASKVWVKAGIFKPDSTKPDPIDDTEKGIYKPLPKFKCSSEDKSFEQAQECARVLSADTKKESGKKKKSNLESFKEELEQIHKDREERHKLKEEMKMIAKSTEVDMFSASDADPTTTNLYVNNLNPKTTEQQLMEMFGKYGPLASVKIMWPRTDEEKTRNKNCGFVAYMSRKDAERALQYMNSDTTFDSDLKIGWGKAILIPACPVYIPPSLLELSLPPPVTGLPFNAQPPKYLPETVTTFDEYLQHCIVKVVIPTDRNILVLIHRMIEFVIQEGLLFEAIMMTREINNPSFRFLFDNHCPAHVYYRWKLYSILQGDSLKQWSLKEFRMFEGGSIWKPPLIQNYTHGMPDDLLTIKEKDLASLKKTLSVTQRDHLEMLIHRLNPDRKKIADAMIFCIQHSDACEEIAECLAQSLEMSSQSIGKTVARLYLITDILYNSKINTNQHVFRKAFESHLPSIMKNMSQVYEYLVNERKQIFYVRISRIFNAWVYWNIYPSAFLEYLHTIFTNSNSKKFLNNNNEVTKECININQDIIKTNTDLVLETMNHDVKENTPIKEEINNKQTDKSLPGFVPSRWETVDPELIESQAMTTSKWSELQINDTSDRRERRQENDYARSKNSENRRKKLREIEVKVMEYQDELEYGKKQLNDHAIAEQVEEYRNMLIKQFEDKEQKEERKSSKKRKEKEMSPKKSKNASRKSTKYY